MRYIIKCHARDSSQLQMINQAIEKIFTQGSENDAAALYELEKQKQQLCQYNQLYQYASTASSVQDLEMLRKALNVNQLNFYMASYGTRLGLAYLVKYPQHVQRIILDGNIAPSNQLSSLIDARALGAVVTFKAFFQDCYTAGNSCVLNQLVSGKVKSSAGLTDRFNQLLIKARQDQGIPTSMGYAHQPVTVGMIKNIMYTEMSPSSWRNLAQALYQAEKSNSGDALMQIYMNNTGYDPKNNHYALTNNATSAAVICEDYLYPDFNNKATWLKFTNQINTKYSQIGGVATLWLTPMCINWQVKGMPLLSNTPQIPPDSTVLSPKVLIVGNAQDPMTPFENAIAVHAYLKAFGISSTILQWNGLSHTALITDSPLSKCVFDNVDQFLLDHKSLNKVPCNDWQNPFVQTAS